MAAEQWIDEMLDQLAAVVSETAILAQQNSQAIADLRLLVSDLREGQAILTQILVEEREER